MKYRLCPVCEDEDEDKDGYFLIQCKSCNEIHGCVKYEGWGDNLGCSGYDNLSGSTCNSCGASDEGSGGDRIRWYRKILWDSDDERFSDIQDSW